MEFTVLRRVVLYSSGRAIDRAEWQLHLERCGMSEFIPLWEVRTLVTDALEVVNDVDEATPPELHAGLQSIRHRLHSALKSLDRAIDRDRGWPRLAARA
jgi:hypothetical protein